MVGRKSNVQQSSSNVVAIPGYRIAGQAAEVAYSVRDLHPIDDGPWMQEADRVAWTDPATGYPCIIRRETPGGHLAGFVAVPGSHSLYGYSPDILAMLGISPHCGAEYADRCIGADPEDRPACHAGNINFGWADAGAPDHDELWWFGFSCGTPFDVRPAQDRREPGATMVGPGRAYRDETYVLAHVIDLASQLHAVGRGDEIPQSRAPAAPAIGLIPPGPKVA